jgi:hypothetical protein
MLDDLLGTIPAKSLTVKAIRLITGLPFDLIIDTDNIPRAPGCYVWAKDENGPVWYIGESNWLPRRLGEQWFYWVYEQIPNEDKTSSDRLEPLGIACWPTAIRAVYENGLQCFASATQRTGFIPEVWEARIQQANKIVSGNMMLIGGSGWEDKEGTPWGDQRLEAFAWAQQRLREMEPLKDKEELWGVAPTEEKA